MSKKKAVRKPAARKATKRPRAAVDTSLITEIRTRFASHAARLKAIEAHLGIGTAAALPAAGN